jgi:hypothetical protein
MRNERLTGRSRSAGDPSLDLPPRFWQVALLGWTKPMTAVAFSSYRNNTMSLATPQIRPSHELDRSRLIERGYTVVRGLFEPEEIARLRTVALETMEELKQQGLTAIEAGREGDMRYSSCDLLSISQLRQVLLDPRLVQAAKELLGGEPSYFGDSSFRIGKNGYRAWHRDNVDRVRWRGGPDWRDPYPLVRCGLYLQDQSRRSGGLAVRPHSNRPGRRLPTLPALVDAGAGDLVAWDLRTVHAGEVVRVRGLRKLALNPRLQTYMPESMRLPDDQPRIVLFMTFGLGGAHLDNLLGYYRTRDYMCDSWMNSRFGPEVWAEAESAGLHVLHPTAEYGTPPATVSAQTQRRVR